MLKNEGIGAFYTGLTAGLTRQVVYTGARLGLFDQFTGMVTWLDPSQDQMTFTICRIRTLPSFFGEGASRNKGHRYRGSWPYY